MKRRDFIINSLVALSGTILLCGCGKYKKVELQQSVVTRRLFNNLSIPLLGFGCMRLPVKTNGQINQVEFEKMVDYSMTHGVNYFDTAYMYMGGRSEIAVGKALKKYDRKSFFLADKNPTPMLNSKNDVLRIFNDQLKKCQTDYFDLYMVHNISKDTIDNYRKFEMFKQLEQLKIQGKLKYLGFSFHGDTQMMKELVKEQKWDFCQLQINYFDWDVMKAKEIYEIAKKANLPVIVMEPLRGGGLCKLNDLAKKTLKQTCPNETPTSYALKWVASKDDVFLILSGMSNLQQIQQNIATFTDYNPLTEQQLNIAPKLTQLIKSQGDIACTVCKYCIDSCPRGINIPEIFSIYNLFKLFGNKWMFKNDYNALKPTEKADRCIGCGACMKKCPQGLDIPKLLKKVDDEVKKD